MDLPWPEPGAVIMAAGILLSGMCCYSLSSEFGADELVSFWHEKRRAIHSYRCQFLVVQTFQSVRHQHPFCRAPAGFAVGIHQQNMIEIGRASCRERV